MGSGSQRRGGRVIPRQGLSSNQLPNQFPTGSYLPPHLLCACLLKAVHQLCFQILFVPLPLIPNPALIFTFSLDDS